MFKKKNKQQEKKTLLGQPDEAYQSFVVNESTPLSISSAAVPNGKKDDTKGKDDKKALSSSPDAKIELDDDKLIEAGNTLRKGKQKNRKEVFVRLHIKDINTVDAASSTVQLQLTVYLTWEDKNYRNEKDGNLTMKIFDPEVEIFNEVKMKSFSTLEVADPKRNLIRKKIHFNGTINTYMLLENFPFDEHRVVVFIRPGKHFSNIVELKFQDNIEHWGGMNIIGGSMSIGLPDWLVGIPDLALQTVQRRAYNPDDRCSQILLTIPMRRISSYYGWKFFLVIAIMTVMSWYTFGMEPSDFNDKMVINLTLFLSTVAFLFVIDKGLPKVPYFTVADQVVTGGFIQLFLATSQNFIVWLLYKSNNNFYDQVNKWSYIAFPTITLLYIMLLALGVWSKTPKHRAVYPDQSQFFRGRVDVFKR